MLGVSAINYLNLLTDSQINDKVQMFRYLTLNVWTSCKIPYYVIKLNQAQRVPVEVIPRYLLEFFILSKP